MRAVIELTKDELKKLIINEFKDRIGNSSFDEMYLSIKVKSSQNYKSEWEDADFKATYEGPID